MSKVEEVVRKIQENPDKISDIFVDGDEIYFRYTRHAFSLIRKVKSPSSSFAPPSDDIRFQEFIFSVYPRYNGDMKTLANAFKSLEEEPQLMSYSTTEYDENFRFNLRQLYKTLQEKVLKLDTIFDDVLEIPPF